MARTPTVYRKIIELRERYYRALPGKESLLKMIAEAEVPEQVGLMKEIGAWKRSQAKVGADNFEASVKTQSAVHVDVGLQCIPRSVE